MNVKCFMVEEEDIGWSRTDGEDERNTEFPWQFGPGAMWWDRYTHFGTTADKELYARARALFVCLPDGTPFCVDGPAYHFDDTTHKVVYGGMWTRTGEPPLVSATPSVNTGSWHGWLTNGELVG